MMTMAGQWFREVGSGRRTEASLLLGLRHGGSWLISVKSSRIGGSIAGTGSIYAQMEEKTKVRDFEIQGSRQLLFCMGRCFVDKGCDSGSDGFGGVLWRRWAVLQQIICHRMLNICLKFF